MSYDDPFSSKAADAFMDGSATAAKWPQIGYVVEGTILSYSMAQQTDYDSGEALYWEGNSRVVESKAENKSRPVMQMRMEIQGEPTGETWEGLGNVRKALPDDDGVRTLYVKGALKSALQAAMRTAGGRLEVGAYVKVARTPDGPKTNPKFAAPHQYAAQWTPAKSNPKTASSFMDQSDESPF